MSVYHLFSRLEKLDINLKLENDKLKIDAPKGLLSPDLLKELKDKKQEIIKFLQKKVKKQTKYISIEPVEKKRYYVLSSAQKRMYFLQQMDPKSTVYNVAPIIELDERPNVKKLEKTFKQLIKRHESLRTSFKMVEDIPVQEIHDHVEFEIEYYDKREVEVKVEVEEGTGGLDPLPISYFIRPFDLSQAPLFRVVLIEVKKGKHILLADMHHIISDGVSHQILEKDFISLHYGAQLPPLRLQYKDYAQWQNSGQQNKAVKQQENYWLNELAGELPLLDLPMDYPRPSIQSFAGATLSFEIPGKETAALREMALEQGTTLYIALLALFNIWLSKLSHQEDIIVGTPTAGRRHTDLENIIGMFINTLPMRSYPLGDKPFQTFLQEVSKRTVKAFENQDYQFEDLVEKVVKNRDPGRNPLFDLMVVLQNIQENTDTGTPPAGEPDKEPETPQYTRGVAMFDMILRGTELGQRIFFEIIYCTKLFKEETIRAFIKHLKTILFQVIETPGKKISQLEILTGEEKQQILADVNEPTPGYPRDKTIHRLFEEQSKRNPDNIALHGCMITWMNGEDASITYKELNRKSDQLAGLLIEKGVLPDTIVGIMSERSIEMIIGILGILKAGGAYMPIDPEYPQERINYMLKDSNAFILLATGDTENTEGASSYPSTLLPFHPSTLPSFHLHLSPAPVTCLAYIIYTSGTTGRPKGVLIEHGNVVSLLLNEKFQFDFNSSDIWTMFHSYCFDFSVWEMYGALLYGGQVVVIPKMVTRDFHGYLQLLKKKTVTILNQTPSAFYNLMKPELEYPKNELNIRYVIFGGEALTPTRLKKWKTKYPGTKLINMYGITETTVHVTFKEITPDEIESYLSNIGKPIPTLSIYILDKYLDLQPIGIAGELYVGGDGVARGYLNQPEFTAEKFVHDLWDYQDYHDGYHSSYKSYRSYIIYKSGDLVRLLAGGDMEYLGRIDQQVKIRGFRVELGEIECQLSRHPQIESCAVMLKEKNNKDKDLCAYIMAANPIPISELRKFLLQCLPEYMVPSYFIFLERIPLTANGKIDRKALPHSQTGAAPGGYIAPKDEIEEKLVHIWSKVLGIEKEKIGIQHDFFELGGNSLNLVMLVSQIFKEFQVEISVLQIYRNPIIKEISGHIKSGRYIEVPVALLNQPGEKKIFCFPPQLGYGITYRDLAHVIQDYSWYAFNFIENIEHGERLKKYVHYIAHLQPKGPYIFYAYSAGGKLAFQVAKALENQGGEVSDIIFWDCFFSNQIIEYDEELQEDLHQQIEELLQKMGAMFLKEKVINKTDEYMKYYHGLNDLEKINANLHLILSEEARNDHELNPGSWNRFTTGKPTVYKGFGKHRQMFTSGGIIEKNAGILREIFNRIEEQRNQSNK